MTRLATAVWPDVRDRPLVLVPVGSIEQHGPHLPLDTDAVVAAELTARVAQLLGKFDSEHLFVAPVLSYGASGEHQAFAGTSSVGTEALHLLVVELVRSMSTWAGRIVLVNGHGGNVTALTGAVARLRDEGHDVAWASGTAGYVDAHAGYTETSLMLHLRPRAVRYDRAEPGNTAPLEELWPALLRGGVAAVSANGVLGDPTGADPDEGARCLEAMAGEVAALVRDGRPDARGMLRRAAAEPQMSLVDLDASAGSPAAEPQMSLVDLDASAGSPAAEPQMSLVDLDASAGSPAAEPQMSSVELDAPAASSKALAP